MRLSRRAKIALNLTIPGVFLLAVIGAFVWEGTAFGGALLMIATVVTPMGWIE
jgi:hypothetical protein